MRNLNEVTGIEYRFGHTFLIIFDDDVSGVVDFSEYLLSLLRPECSWFGKGVSAETPGRSRRNSRRSSVADQRGHVRERARSYNVVGTSGILATITSCRARLMP